MQIVIVGAGYVAVGKPDCGSVGAPDLRNRLISTRQKREGVLT